MTPELFMLHMAATCLSIFASIYGMYLLIQKFNISREFIMSLFSTDPKSPSTTRFVFILSGVISTFCLWGTWMFCQIANIYYTHTEDVVSMVEIPTGVYLAYAVALVGPGAVRIGQSVWGKKSPCPGGESDDTEEIERKPYRRKTQKEIEDEDIRKFEEDQGKDVSK